MNIAIDYDDTYTKDPHLWDRFIRDAKENGHRVWIVTCRRDTDENREDLGKPSDCVVFFTSLSPKHAYMAKMGLNVDVWIDDDPACILHGK